MRADFTITIHDVEKPLAVRVMVHENLRSMRAACTLSDRKFRRKKDLKNQFKDTLGICERFNIQALQPVYCIVRFAPPHIGAGMVAHEMTHAAVHLWHIKTQFTDVPIDCENDEWFCWILGELVRRTTDQLYRKGVYQ